jgi:hypothetical protein
MLDPKDALSLTPVLTLLSQSAKHLDIFKNGNLKLTMSDATTIGIRKQGNAGSWFTTELEELQELKQ